jgi:hypothetical protein
MAGLTLRGGKKDIDFKKDYLLIYLMDKHLVSGIVL